MSWSGLQLRKERWAVASFHAEDYRGELQERTGRRVAVVKSSKEKIHAPNNRNRDFHTRARYGPRGKPGFCAKFGSTEHRLYPFPDGLLQ
jgi:hypothetical protein